MKLKRGQTRLAAMMSAEADRIAIDALRKHGREMTVYEIGEAVGIHPERVRRALVKALKQGIVTKSCPKGDGQGMKRHMYSICSKEERVRSINPFEVAAGMVLPTIGWNGRVHYMADDELEEMAA